MEQGSGDGKVVGVAFSNRAIRALLSEGVNGADVWVGRLQAEVGLLPGGLTEEPGGQWGWSE